MGRRVGPEARSIMGRWACDSFFPFPCSKPFASLANSLMRCQALSLHAFLQALSIYKISFISINTLEAGNLRFGLKCGVCKACWEEHRLWRQTDLGVFPALLHTNSWLLGKSLNFSKSQFPHPHTSKNSPHLQRYDEDQTLHMHAVNRELEKGVNVDLCPPGISLVQIRNSVENIGIIVGCLHLE